MGKILCVLFIFISVCCVQGLFADNDTPPISVNATGFSEFDYVTYYGFTGKKIKVGWDPSSGNATFYQLQAYLVEQEHYTLDVRLGGNVTSYTYTFPKGGHYVFRIRAGNSRGYSRWAVSTNAADSMVHGVHRAWWVYTHVAPPSDIDIN